MEGPGRRQARTERRGQLSRLTYYTTSSAKLASLNTMAIVFEYEVDAAGNTKTRVEITPSIPKSRAPAMRLPDIWVNRYSQRWPLSTSAE